MKKAWNIDQNNLILRIIVTYLGTRGTASVLINVTDKYAGLGLIVVMSALFSVLYTILFSYYGKHSRMIGAAFYPDAERCVLCRFVFR